MVDDSALTPNFFAPGVMSHHVALEGDDFERSFYYNLLLQPPVSILDTSFFIVKEMEEQYNAPVGLTWLKAALEIGALIPIFRDGHSFRDVVAKLKSDHFTGLRPNAEEIARGLDSHGVKEFRRFPSRSEFHMGRSLGDRLQHLFLQREAPVLSRFPDRTMLEISEFWDRTASWRHEWIETAVSARDYQDHGLRLSDLYLIAAKTLDPGAAAHIINGQDVLAVAQRSLKDATGIADVRNLLVLMDLVWQQNFRVGMRKAGVAMGLCLPRWQRVLSYFDLDILPPADFGSPQDEAPEVSDAVEIELTIELPTLRALKQTDGGVIRKVWGNGGTYRRALHDWRRSPTNANYRFLARELGQYSEIIRRAVQAGTSVEKFDVASLATNLLIPMVGGAAAGISTVYAVQHMEGLSDEAKNALPIATGQLSQVLLMIPSAIGWRHKTEARIGREEITVGSGQKQIVLT